MKTLYLDCSMGAAGDMLTAALLELHPNPDAILARLGDLHLPGVTVAAEPAENGGMRGTHMAVTVHGESEEDEHHHHHHATPATISHLLSHLNLPGAVRTRVQRVYDRIAKAESEAHGVPVSEIHFHEVGALDAMADIAAVCLLMDALRPDRVVVSPICVGAGSVRCAHGVLPVPAPATARLLTGAPIYGSDFPGELCTPTGAALLMEFATAFGAMPPMTLEKVGVGIGSKTFPKANCLRAFLGETQEAPDTVFELLCTVDDMPAEDIAFACETILAAGALDVCTQAVGMKKSRPGTMIRVLCRENQRQEMAALLFRHTTTLGIREVESRRYVLTRALHSQKTPLGEVRKKVARGWGVTREKWEYEDLAAIAREKELSLSEVRKALENAGG